MHIKGEVAALVGDNLGADRLRLHGAGCDSGESWTFLDLDRQCMESGLIVELQQVTQISPLSELAPLPNVAVNITPLRSRRHGPVERVPFEETVFIPTRYTRKGASNKAYLVSGGNGG